VSTVEAATIDARGRDTRSINQDIRQAIADGAPAIDVLHPGSRHNLAVGILEPARITFRGDVGYFCGGLSDGLDISRGVDSSSPTQSVDLQRAVNESQRRGVAIYGFYSPSIVAAANPALVSNAQSSLLRLSEETGGLAFFQGTGAPVSFQPFIRELDTSLQKQAALTFLSTHLSKGFHKLEVKSSTPGVRVAYPSGYVR